MGGGPLKEASGGALGLIRQSRGRDCRTEVTKGRQHLRLEGDIWVAGKPRAIRQLSSREAQGHFIRSGSCVPERSSGRCADKKMLVQAWCCQLVQTIG